MASMTPRIDPGEVLLGAHEVRGACHDQPVGALHARLLGERGGERVEQRRVAAVGRLDLTRSSDTASIMVEPPTRSLSRTRS